ncbi:MAG: NAD(P)H-binding protein, partial [Chitinophagaceae bacterium]|nr:NAD(P)H-binding protein [Chitinophagaceae bacterium]
MDDTRNNRILVTGATGFLGINLVHHLCASGFTVRVLVRQGSSIKHLPEQQCEICYGQVDQPEDVHRAVAGCRYVVHAAGITGQWGIP